MNDLISRQAAIDTTWEDPPYTDPLNVLSEVRDRIKALSSAQPEQRWIPVSEKLPKPYEYCLWTTTDGRVIYHHCDGLFSNYTAWMPLPEPYKKGEQDD